MIFTTTEWLIVTGALLLIPVIVIPFSRFMVKIGRGYNNIFSRSVLTIEAQAFAAQVFGRMMFRFGLLMLVFIPAIGGIGFAFLDNETVIMTLLWIMIVVPLILIVVPIIVTERAVRMNFDKNGKPYK